MKQFPIEPIARAVIVHRGRILLCQIKGKRYFFLPGGHMNFRETAARALERELKEELMVKPNTAVPIGIVQNFFERGGRRYHELYFVYHVTLPRYDIVGQEDHITFHWKPVLQLKTLNLEPKVLRHELPRWLKYRKFFFVTER
ncbi:MAG: NUDIX domain-containing protein [bacterium]|nr:NUDIX domain-containing protein [bacterium]